MIHRIKNMFGQPVHSFEWHPSKNPSQAVKSYTDKRQPLSAFKHGWYAAHDYIPIAVANLSFFHMNDPESLHMGLLARDQGFVDGVPNNGYEMWLNNDYTLHIAQLNTVGVAGIGTDWKWAASLAYPLVKDGKKFLDPNVKGFSRTEKTERTAYGQKADKTLVMAIARDLNGEEMADVMLSLGCVNAVMGDGGGSTQMMVDGEYIWQGRDVGTVLMVFAKPGEKVQVIDETATDKPVLIIDPGHGGKDPGGGSNQHWLEKDMVLDISLYQYERFKTLGVPVALTRDADVYLSPEERTRIVRESGARYCMSNHINAGGGDGAETIHSIYASSVLAATLAEEIRKEGQNIRRTFSRTLPYDSKKDYYYMHRDTGSVETTITEYGFADSKKDDVQQLLTDWKDYAEAVVRGFCKHILHPYTPPAVIGRDPKATVTWGELEQYMKEKGLI